MSRYTHIFLPTFATVRPFSIPIVLRVYVHIYIVYFFGCHKSERDGTGQIVVLVVILLVASSLCRHLLKYPVSLL